MNSPKIELANKTIAQEVAECLNKHYQGHAWAVNANVETGLVSVYNLNLSGRWGFVLKMDDLANDPSMKITIRAGGELLERYNISRGSMKQHEMDNVQYDFKGEAKQYG